MSTITSTQNHANIQDKTNLKVRDLNLELLRIVAMFMVLVIHYNQPIRGIPSVELWQSDFGNVSLTIVVQSLVVVCVNCFILISGYFGIRWKWKSFSNLLFQILFFLIVAYIASLFLQTESSPKGIFYFLLSRFTGNWFIIAYLGLYMIAPILETYVNAVTVRQLAVFIIVFYGFSTLFGYVLRCSPEFNEGMSFISLGAIYLVGALLRKSKEKVKKVRGWKVLVGYLLCAFMLTSIFVIELSFGYNHSPIGFLNPIVIIQSVCLFMFFLRLKISDRWHIVIMFLSSSAFAVFLLHTSLRTTFDELCRCAHNISNGSLFFVLIILVGVFLLSVIIDKPRQQLFKTLMKYF